jgi:predicted dehydrogenase
MTARVKVIGAGSIGNHLGHGCRTLGMDVTICDIDRSALERAREVIYPNRYGSWDEAIRLATPDELVGEDFDIVIVGTPPATHLKVATAELETTRPGVILIEKPLAHPSSSDIEAFLAVAEKSSTRVLVGYNQRLKPNTKHFVQLANTLDLGPLVALSSNMLESWDGILKAHFWMKSERDSYLAFTDQGGGALLEHSHALNLFLYFADVLGQGRVTDVVADIEWVSHEDGRYDRDSALSLTLESGLVGTVRQDLHTWPASKEAIATFEKGALLWSMGDSSDRVEHRSTSGELIEAWDFPKTRPDDFIGELEHLRSVWENPTSESPIGLPEGLAVMDLILAAFESSGSGASEAVKVRN